MATLLRRWWSSYGHSVHSPTAYRLITLLLDQRGVSYYPEHAQQAALQVLTNDCDRQLALHLLHQWPLDRFISAYDGLVSPERALILWDTTPLSPEISESRAILWHIGSQMPQAFQERQKGFVIDYLGGQLLIADPKLPPQTYWTRLRR